MGKKKTERYILLFALACCAAFAVYRVLRRAGADTLPPVISIPSETLVIPADAGDAALLGGVTATDRKDGDVTASLMVEQISGYSGEKGCAEVVIAAFDAAGNVAKAKRDIRLENYVSPHFTLNGPLRFSERSRMDVFGVIGAEDVLDGSLTDRVKGTLLEGGASISAPGIYQVEFRVTNSIGDTAYLTLPVEIYGGSSETFELELKDYLVYLETGSRLEPEDYLKNVSIGEQSYTPDHLPEGMELKITSDLNTNTPGVYRISYDVTFNQYQGATCLLVVVEDK
ncbi:MAG: hypothetical protein MJ118_08530 [Clostridia bacterium]|nr:hypothetical protein [Clostridia bacterium]